MRSKKSKTVVLAAAAVTALSLSSCGYKQASPGVIGVVQHGGWTNMAEKNLIDCIKPTESKGEFNNTVFWYPAHQISWDARGEKNQKGELVSEHEPYVVVSNKDAPINMDIPVVVRFNLTQDCNLLKKFHADIAVKYNGWLDDNGNETDGWRKLVDYTVGQPLQATLLQVAQNYPWQQIWNDEDVRLKFQNALAQELPDATKRLTNNTEYFTGFVVQVFKPMPQDPSVLAGVTAAQATIAKANADKVAADAQRATADAQTQTAIAEANKQKAIIDGYGGIENYIRAQMVDKGLNPYQPTYVVPQPAH